MPVSALPKLKVPVLKRRRLSFAATGKGAEFKNGRHFAAWPGLVHRQHSSGDRQVLLTAPRPEGR